MKELPKALSADERAELLRAVPAYAERRRALALIDAQAALLAEYAAQAVVDGQRIAELESQSREGWAKAGWNAAGEELQQQAGQAHLARAEAAEALVFRTTPNRSGPTGVGGASGVAVIYTNAAAAVASSPARIAELERERDEALAEWKRISAHLANQPAAPEVDDLVRLLGTQSAVGERCASCGQRLDAEFERDAYHQELLDRARRGVK
jgi:hypothetical protein